MSSASPVPHSLISSLSSKFFLDRPRSHIRFNNATWGPNFSIRCPHLTWENFLDDRKWPTKWPRAISDTDRQIRTGMIYTEVLGGQLSSYWEFYWDWALPSEQLSCEQLSCEQLSCEQQSDEQLSVSNRRWAIVGGLLWLSYCRWAVVVAGCLSGWAVDRVSSWRVGNWPCEQLTRKYVGSWRWAIFVWANIGMGNRRVSNWRCTVQM